MKACGIQAKHLGITLKEVQDEMVNIEAEHLPSLSVDETERQQLNQQQQQTQMAQQAQQAQQQQPCQQQQPATTKQKQQSCQQQPVSTQKQQQLCQQQPTSPQQQQPGHDVTEVTKPTLEQVLSRLPSEPTLPERAAVKPKKDTGGTRQIVEFAYRHGSGKSQICMFQVSVARCAGHLPVAIRVAKLCYMKSVEAVNWQRGCRDAIQYRALLYGLIANEPIEVGEPKLSREDVDELAKKMRDASPDLEAGARIT